MLKQLKNRKYGDTWFFLDRIMKKSESSVSYNTSNPVLVRKVRYLCWSLSFLLEQGENRNSVRVFSVELRDPSEYFKTGDTVLVFTSSEPVGDKLERVLEVENTMVQEAPHVVQYPAYDGKSLITVNLTTVIDPDGHLVEINHIMDGLDLNSN